MSDWVELEDQSETTLVEQAKAVVRREAAAVAALADQLDVGVVKAVELMLACPGHVLVTGAGTSHAMAQRFAHLLACVGTPAVAISAADALHGGAGAVREGDVVYVISKGGHSVEVNDFVDIAKSRGAIIVAQTENPDAPLAQKSDAVYLVRPEADIDPYGMVATGSSLVNGAAGDALCVLLLALRGYSKQAFGETHPGGAVGRKLADEEE
jgi:arabinose-5-phosphate isomerase